VRLLVTGGSGFIGGHLIRRLLQRGHEIAVLDIEHSLDTQSGHAVEGVDYEFIQGDVRHADTVRRAVTGVECIVHLAALTGVGQSMYETVDYSLVNCVGTATLLSAMESAPSLRRVVVASSRAVYGEGAHRCFKGHLFVAAPRSREALQRGEWDHRCSVCGSTSAPVPTGESTVPVATSIYGSTKLFQEQAIRAVSTGRGVEWAALRLFNVYGPGQLLSNPYTGILGVFARQGRARTACNLYEDGLMVRDFVFIDDVVAAFAGAVERPLNVVDPVMNIGTGVPTTLRDLATMLSELQGAPAPQVSSDYRVGDIRHCYADVQKAEEVLGFRAGTGLKTGLARYLDWFETQEIPAVVDATAELENKGLFGSAGRGSASE